MAAGLGWALAVTIAGVSATFPGDHLPAEEIRQKRFGPWPVWGFGASRIKPNGFFSFVKQKRSWARNVNMRPNGFFSALISGGGGEKQTNKELRGLNFNSYKVYIKLEPLFKYPPFSPAG